MAPEIIDSIEKDYFGYTVTAFTTEVTVKMWSSVPWRFKIGCPDGKTREFHGVPNKVETRAKALKRGWYRAKWLSEGSHDERYKIEKVLGMIDE